MRGMCGRKAAGQTVGRVSSFELAHVCVENLLLKCSYYSLRMWFSGVLLSFLIWTMPVRGSLSTRGVLLRPWGQLNCLLWSNYLITIKSWGIDVYKQILHALLHHPSDTYSVLQHLYRLPWGFSQNCLEKRIKHLHITDKISHCSYTAAYCKCDCNILTSLWRIVHVMWLKIGM